MVDLGNPALLGTNTAQFQDNQFAVSCPPTFSMVVLRKVEL
jgi:hypothetical protein